VPEADLILISHYQPARGTHFAAERRQHMTPTEMQEKAMQIFGQGMH
jgi:hypothetical protein